MARDQPGRNTPIEEDEPDVPTPSVKRRKRHVRRGGVRRKVPNPFVDARRYYAFLASMDGGDDGPWLAQFECILARWLDDTIAPGSSMGHHDIDQIRDLLQGRSYERALEDASVAGRVVLRRLAEAYNRFTECLVERHALPIMAVYQVRIFEEELGQLTDPFGGAGDVLQPGAWYALEVVRAPHRRPSWEHGMLTEQDPATERFIKAKSWMVAELRNLRVRSGGVVSGDYHSQATLRALNYLRAELD